jgi:hypothetical protein
MSLHVQTSRRQACFTLAGAAAVACGGRISLGASPTATPTTVRLPIPPRLQWEDLDGYCGECVIQQAALLFGTYVSQFTCRGIIQPDQQSQLLVGVNERAVLSALRLTSAAFDSRSVAKPQFPAYFTWVKQHLLNLHPVMIVAYVQGLDDSDYDHIMLATGIQSRGPGTLPTDQLFFNDPESLVVNARVAATLADTRPMRGNGARFEVCIPQTTCFGCAVTGIQDLSRQALPVQVAIGKASEPDVIAGAAPQPLDAVVTISQLVPGKPYTLYRYDDHRSVPTTNYAKSRSTSATKFVATAPQATFPAVIRSNGVAVFRCLPAGV